MRTVDTVKKLFIPIAICLLSVAHAAAHEDSDKTTVRFTGYGDPFGTTEDGTLDPMRSYQLLFFNLQHQIFETLVGIDHNTQQVIPLLAETWKKIDSKTIRFYLQHGVRFHNGEQFTAEAVRFSFELMTDPRNKYAGRYLLDSVARVDVIDRYTLDVVLHFPDALILRKLASIGYMFPPQYYKKVGNDYFTRHPMGTGPFRYLYSDTNMDGVKEIHFYANEDYWEPGLPAFSELVYCFYPGERQWEALKNGRVDMVITQYIDDDAAQSPSVKLFTQQTLRNSACILNIDKPGPLADLRVRQALQYCINRRAIIDRALKGYGKALHTIVPEGAFGYASSIPLYSENIVRARELLARAGYPGGFTLNLMASSTRHTIDVISVLQEQLSQVGITLVPHLLNRKEILDEIITPKLMGTSQPGRHDIWVVTGWPSMFGTGTTFYFMFLHSRGMYNFGTYLNRESPVDELYTRAIQSTDRESFRAGLQKLDRYLLEQSLVIPLYQVELIYGMRPDIIYSPGLNDLPHQFKNCTVSESSQQ